MRLRARIAWIVVVAFALVAFVSALVAVWQPSDSHARSGWGGTAVVVGLTTFVLAGVAVSMSEEEEE